MEQCNRCGVLSCQESTKGWEVTDGGERTVTFTSEIDCIVRSADINEEAVDPNEAKQYMVRLLNNVGMPDIAKALHQRTIFLANPSENNSVTGD